MGSFAVGRLLRCMVEPMAFWLVCETVVGLRISGEMERYGEAAITCNGKIYRRDTMQIPMLMATTETTDDTCIAKKTEKKPQEEHED
jgi:hypothetical protein